VSASVPVVAIIGRTNVGKSTLFNAIVGGRRAIIQGQPGVTRDRHYALVERWGKPFSLVDTGGLADEKEDQLATAVRQQTELAVSEADLLVVVFDGLYGVHPLDREMANTVRKAQKPTLYVVNKCEKDDTKLEANEFYELGVNNLIFLSAAHRRGLKQLMTQVQSLIVGTKVAPKEESDNKSPTVSPIKLAIIGRPNVGKSSLINKFLGKDRLVVSPISGTTRDSIEIPLRREGHDFILFDTAGLRKKGKVNQESVERYSNLRALRSLVDSNVALLLLDAGAELGTEQEVKIAWLALERGRGLIVVVNKWDLPEKDNSSQGKVRAALQRQMPFTEFCPIVFVSALSGKNCPELFKKAVEVYNFGSRRLKTSELNTQLQKAIEKRPAPNYRGEPIKLKFIAQTGVLPPTFSLTFNRPTKIREDYLRYLRKAIREIYPFTGWELKFELKATTRKKT